MDGEIMGQGVIEKGQRERGCLPSSELIQSIKNKKGWSIRHRQKNSTIQVAKKVDTKIGSD